MDLTRCPFEVVQSQCRWLADGHCKLLKLRCENAKCSSSEPNAATNELTAALPCTAKRKYCSVDPILLLLQGQEGSIR